MVQRDLALGCIGRDHFATQFVDLEILAGALLRGNFLA